MMKEGIWNPWHGCIKYSEGCANCYVYRRDALYGKDSSLVVRTGEFDLPLRKGRDGSYRIPSGSGIFACMTSDFFIEAADEWRDAVWSMIRQRSDVNFNIITKRVLRIRSCLPEDWGDGWENVAIGATVENQRRAEERLDEFLMLPIVIVGGESGASARTLDYSWVLTLREECLRTGTGFHFKQTGARFVKDGKLYNIERLLQMPQARRAGIDIPPRDNLDGI